MISLLFFILASICNSVQDTLVHHHPKSIFKKYTKGFWSDAFYESWKNKYINNDPLQGRKKILGINIHPMFTDAWHCFKSLMIIFICLSIATFDLNCLYIFDYWICVLIVVTVYGTLWNLAFSIFYDKILIKKN